MHLIALANCGWSLIDDGPETYNKENYSGIVPYNGYISNTLRSVVTVVPNSTLDQKQYIMTLVTKHDYIEIKNGDVSLLYKIRYVNPYQKIDI